jgi:subtilisin family serine protease
MSRDPTRRGSRTAFLVTIGFGAVALGAAACGPPPPPPRDPALCGTSASALASPAAPLSAAAAEAAITHDIATNPYREPDGDIPVVTVERDGSDVRIETVSADDEAEAVDVARNAATDSDLVGVEVDSRVTALTTNDADYSQVWALHKTTFESAWTTNDGTGATVAVVDSGVQANHPDLNGKVDPGWQFVNNGSLGVPFSGTDPSGHGTHVAGTIGAIANNSIGVAGMAPGARILPVRVLNANGNGSASDVAKGITWAADNGADVINLSLGGPESTGVEAAIDHANALGVVVVAAAGNEGKLGNPPSYPAAYNRTIAVAALYLKNNGGLGHASYSTANCYVDVAAPGTAIVSTWPAGTYAYESGTSMATPHVSAAAALIKAEFPTCSPNHVAKALRSTAGDMSPTGRDNLTGFGKINPNAALNAAASFCP